MKHHDEFSSTFSY